MMLRFCIDEEQKYVYEVLGIFYRTARIIKWKDYLFASCSILSSVTGVTAATLFLPTVCIAYTVYLSILRCSNFCTF